MPLYSDEAIVLRTRKLAEADRIITLLTRQHGVVRAVAKGVRRTTSRFGSRLEPFTHVDLQLAEGRNLDVVTQAETRSPFGEAISAEYDRYTAASVMLETAERLVVEEREPAIQQYLLLVGALRTMAAGEHRPAEVMGSFVLRSLSVAGYAPSFDGCVRCGVEGQHRAFHPASGGVLCPSCRVPGSAYPAVETVRLLGAMLAGDWAVVDAAEDRHRREARGLVSAYLAWHLERGLRSMPYATETLAAADTRAPESARPGDASAFESAPPGDTSTFKTAPPGDASAFKTAPPGDASTFESALPGDAS